jgi:thioredoxin-like negative regulator of GroEL
VDLWRFNVRKRNKVVLLAVVAILAVALLAVPLFSGCGTDKSDSDTSKQADTSESAQVDSGVASSGSQTGQSKSEQAVEQAKAEGKPVLLNFHGSGCIPCVQMEKNLTQVEPEYKGRVAFVIVEVYDQSEYNFCMKYNIETIPTTVFIRKDGTVAKGYVGVLEPDQLKKELDALL